VPVQLLALQGNGGSAVPYERRNAPYTLNSIALNPQDAMRLKRYEESWRFFQGLHWSFTREDGEPLVTANYCKTIVHKKASWLVGKGMVNSVPEALQEITKPKIDEVWKYNAEPVLLNNMAVTSGVTGDGFILVTYQPPSDAMMAVNPYTQGKIRLRLLGSHQVFPYWNPLNSEELLSVRIITEVPDFGPVGPEDGRRTPMVQGSLGVSRRRRYIENITATEIVEGWEEDGAPTRRPNDLGEIPLVHWVNESFPNEYYGMSDLDGVIDLQRELNEKMTDVSDIVNYHAAPVTIITGAKAKNLERGPKSMWAGLPADAKVFNLTLGSDLPASTKYIETIRQMMMDVSSIPEGSLGRIQPVSNTSAAALQVQFQPLVEAIERKKASFQLAVEKINYFILRFDQLVNGTSYPVDICKNCGGRIIEVEDSPKGNVIPLRKGRKKKKCYLIDPQTLDFMDPDDVLVKWRRKFSFGVETKEMKYGDVKETFLKESASYWDPAPKVDLEEKAQDDHDRARAVQAHHAGEQQAADEHEHAVAEASKPAPKDVLPPPPQPRAGPLPKELDKAPEVKPEQLANHDMDVPEEPETVRVIVKTWDANAKQFVTEDLGELKIVPSGCSRPVYLSPYSTTCSLRTPLPRNKQEDANLYAVYQTNGWSSRRWIRDHLDEEMDGPKLDEEIANDIPFLAALTGKPIEDPLAAQVAQTPGATGSGPGGSNNGAPPPPGPGPGRGNKAVPGDNAASKPATPPNAKPGVKV
jgi:hypothetical protein